MKTIRMMFVMLVAVTFVGLSFVYFTKTEQTRLRNNFENDALKIKGYTKDSAEFVNMLRLFAEKTLKNGPKTPADIRYLTYDRKTNQFSADRIEGTNQQPEKGNITGIGPIDETVLKKQEIEMADELNPYFKETYHAFPNIAWIYYTSLSGFNNLFPFVPSSEFHFTKNLLNEEKTKRGSFKENPYRSVYWSEPYVDHAGKGMMVSVSAPVDFKGRYVGCVTIDLTFESLSNQLTKGYTSILANANGQILASSDKSFLPANKIATIGELDPYHTTEFQKTIQRMPNDDIKTVHGVQILKKEVPGTDWSFYYVLTNQEKTHQIAGKLFVVVLIATLVVWIFWIAEKRKIAENQLKVVVSELADNNSELKELSVKDALTGVLNRRGIEHRIQSEVSLAKKEQHELSFILLDIDSFKQINDYYGHTIGDYVLKESATVITNSIRGDDAIGRWGGEEFLLILPHTGYEHALQLADRLRQKVSSHPLEIGGCQIPVTITFGVSVYNSERGVKESIDRADQAMYKGKQNGKNQVVGETDL